MTLHEVLNRFDGVKARGQSEYMARCPCHDDRKASLSIGSGKNGGVVLKCQAGCDTADILSRVGLSMKDLFNDEMKPDTKPHIVATYDYRAKDGTLLAQKLRKSDKSFSWRRPDGKGGWIYNRQGVPRMLYIAGQADQTVYVCEGEKDCNNLSKLGCFCVSGEDGAGHNKWLPEYTQMLAGRSILILPDNDKVGWEYAQEVAASVRKTAKSVKVLDLATAWHDMPDKGDISDMIAVLGEEKTREILADLEQNTQEWIEEIDDPFLACFKTLDQFEEEEATWLVPGWIPEGQITLMAADGGIGKTTMWCNMIAALSSGKQCVLDPPGITRSSMTVAFLTTEDSVRKKLRKKLREAGATMNNVLTPDFMADKTGLLRNLKFGSADMARFIRYYKPALCVFDPVQGFIPPDLNMGSRNAMRDCMAPLISLGEEVGTTFLVVCHTNKRKGASGRDRVADSADLWDISRSVIMAGYTEEQGVRYLSNEKNNYEQLQETILFSIDGLGQIQTEGTTWKRDREFMQEAAFNISAPKREDCKSWILTQLAGLGGSVLTKDLEEKAKLAGYSMSTLRRAKDELKQDGQVKYFHTGGSQDRVWHIQLVDDFVELPDGTSTPFDDLLA